MHLRRYPALGGLILALALVYLGSHAVQSNWSYFTMYRFKWTAKTVGISLAVVGALVGLVQGVLIRWITPRIGNEKSIYIGLLLYAAGMFLFAFSTQSWMMFVFLVPYCLGGIAGPALQAIMSGHVPPNAQGELQGALTSVMSLTAIVGPLLMTNLFAYFTSAKAPVLFPGAPFLLGGLLMLSSSVVAYKSLKQN
jgi:DHA1 family tetracycline resistance protein-like MFS transporter